MSNTQGKRRAPINTEQEAREEPIIPVAKAMMMGSSESIYAQEAEGQRQLVNSDTLPTSMPNYGGPDAKEVLEAAGVVFGEVVEGDPLFQYVTLPEGWKKEGTSHSMHSKLLDDKGRTRAGIFYKAAFYDRRADLNLERRFDVRLDYDRLEKGEAIALVTDCGQTIYTTEPIKFDVETRGQEERKTVTEAATQWLEDKHPDWMNPAAYWD